MSGEGKPVCDFCRAPDVKWTYPAKPFTLGVGSDADGLIAAIGSDEWWAACDACHALIERGDKDEVARRAIRTSEREGALSRDPKMRGVVIHGIVMIHSAFYENRTGPALPSATA
jgi:hypothetical protein